MWERYAAWPYCKGPIVQSIEGVQARDERAPPEDSSESQKDTRFLQNDSHKNHQAYETRLEEECGILARTTSRWGLGKTLLENEVSSPGNKTPI